VFFCLPCFPLRLHPLSNSADKQRMKSPVVEAKPPETKSTPEDPKERVKRLTELLRARFAQEASVGGGSAALLAWLRTPE